MSPRRSGVPTQHSAPAASIAARPASERVVIRTACPPATISAASVRPRHPPPTINIRATERHLTRARRRRRDGRRGRRVRVRRGSTTIRSPDDSAREHERGRAHRRRRGRRDDGQDRRALQAPRLHLPLLGDLRRRRLDLRLRALRGAAEEQRQGRVVARDAPGARRHRRARLGDPAAPARVGGLRPPRGLHRPARRLSHVRAALPRRSPRGAAVRAQTLEAPRGDRGVRPDARRATST